MEDPYLEYYTTTTDQDDLKEKHKNHGQQHQQNHRPKRNFFQNNRRKNPVGISNAETEPNSKNDDTTTNKNFNAVPLGDGSKEEEGTSTTQQEQQDDGDNNMFVEWWYSYSASASSTVSSWWSESSFLFGSNTLNLEQDVSAEEDDEEEDELKQVLDKGRALVQQVAHQVQSTLEKLPTNHQPKKGSHNNHMLWPFANHRHNKKPETWMDHVTRTSSSNTAWVLFLSTLIWVILWRRTHSKRRRMESRSSSSSSSSVDSSSSMSSWPILALWQQLTRHRRPVVPRKSLPPCPMVNLHFLPEEFHQTKNTLTTTTPQYSFPDHATTTAKTLGTARSKAAAARSTRNSPYHRPLRDESEPWSDEEEEEEDHLPVNDDEEGDNDHQPAEEDDEDEPGAEEEPPPPVDTIHTPASSSSYYHAASSSSSSTTFRPSFTSDLPDSFAPLLSSSHVQMGRHHNVTPNLLHGWQGIVTARLKPGRHEVPLNSTDPTRPQFTMAVPQQAQTTTMGGSSPSSPTDHSDVHSTTSSHHHHSHHHHHHHHDHSSSSHGGCKITVTSAIGSHGPSMNFPSPMASAASHLGKDTTSPSVVQFDAFDLDSRIPTSDRTNPMVKHLSIVVDPPLPLLNVAPTLIHFPSLFTDQLLTWRAQKYSLVRMLMNFIISISTVLERLLWFVEAVCQIHLAKIEFTPRYYPNYYAYKNQKAKHHKDSNNNNNQKKQKPKEPSHSSTASWQLVPSFSGHVLLLGWIPIPFLSIVLPSFIIPRPHALLESLLTLQPFASAKLKRHKIAQEKLVLAALEPVDRWTMEWQLLATPPAMEVDVTLPGGLAVAVELGLGRNPTGRYPHQDREDPDEEDHDDDNDTMDQKPKKKNKKKAHRHHHNDSQTNAKTKTTRHPNRSRSSVENNKAPHKHHRSDVPGRSSSMPLPHGLHRHQQTEDSNPILSDDRRPDVPPPPSQEQQQHKQDRQRRSSLSSLSSWSTQSSKLNNNATNNNKNKNTDAASRKFKSSSSSPILYNANRQIPWLVEFKAKGSCSHDKLTFHLLKFCISQKRQPEPLHIAPAPGPASNTMANRVAAPHKDSFISTNGSFAIWKLGSAELAARRMAETTTTNPAPTAAGGGSSTTPLRKLSAKSSSRSSTPPRRPMMRPVSSSSSLTNRWFNKRVNASSSVAAASAAAAASVSGTTHPSALPSEPMRYTSTGALDVSDSPSVAAILLFPEETTSFHHHLRVSSQVDWVIIAGESCNTSRV